MALATVTHTYDAPKDKVWKVFADIGNVQEISPNIESSKRENQKKGQGARRSCEFGKGAGITEEVTLWKDGETLAFTGVEFRKTPMKHMVATFQFAELDGKTTVACAMDFSMKFPPLNLIAKGQMKKNLKQMLAGAEKKL